MRAAVLKELGGVPVVVDDWPEPEGPAVGRVLAAGLNPIDLRRATGALGDKPPYVIGSEAVVEYKGRRLYVTPGATFAERVAFDPAQAILVPDGVDDAVAVAYGIAGMAGWLSLERGRLQPGETVLVLGASGTVGMIAVQAARAMGAGRVVAAARSEEGLQRAARRGAAATVRLGERPLTEEGPYQLVIDPLWGAPASEALAALEKHGRLVNLGESAGSEASFPSALVRFGELEILGHTNFEHGIESRRRAYEGMCAAGIEVDVEVLPLDAVADAWRRQAESPNVKLVLRP
jgi:NADPH2:quinone reductase